MQGSHDNFTVTHCKGRKNANADALSRIPQEELCFALKKIGGNVMEQDMHPVVQSKETRIQEAGASGSFNQIKNEANELNYRKH